MQTNPNKINYDFEIYCIKSTSKFDENNIYTCTYMEGSKYDDPLDPLLYNVYNKEKNVSMPYRISQFKKYFVSLQELRKLKLCKISKLAIK